MLCGHDLSNRHVFARYCLGCAQKANAAGGAAEAHTAVKRAISRGEMPPAKTLVCVDCGKQARDYDHRDYNKPLEVVPVCRPCNKLRGPAIQVESLRVPRARVDLAMPPVAAGAGGCNA